MELREWSRVGSGPDVGVNPRIGSGRVECLLLHHPISPVLSSSLCYAVEQRSLQRNKSIRRSLVILEALDALVELLGKWGLVFLYGNGKGRAPTAIHHDKAMLKDLLFNQSPANINPGPTGRRLRRGCSRCYGARDRRFARAALGAVLGFRTWGGSRANKEASGS
ncbi:hypothetical protein CRG98_017492 [Punica granatum]|uniref:Uncharacterized protein n=1 Tax=Punica granatum TaxID=22663 RepID=A0A2I0K0P5_PUNGR|nr:hypothetical protein CRG98_017492 [Punica granatum]